MDSVKRPLWAPWRIDFLRAKKDKKCFLCGQEKATDSEEEKIIIARGRTVFALLNRYPYNSGHLMIAPYRHTGDISELSAEERNELMEMSVKAKEVLHKLMKPDGYNIGFNLGAAAGAGVADHIHMHIVPRWNGDTNFMPVLADTRVVPETLEKTAELLMRAWQNKNEN
ncbi:MAG: HIT family hydrolase [Lentisphaerae bacterium GWF2_44_16]|nr:MAG: HIT family hydrolase [Lentisphaerae bacterium GWF2_44_16]